MDNSTKVYTPVSYLPLDVPLHIIPNLPYGLSPLHEVYPGRPMTIYYSPTREDIPNENPELDIKYLDQLRKETAFYIQEQKDLNKLPPDEQRVIPLAYVEPEYVNESPSLSLASAGQALPPLPPLPQSNPKFVFGANGEEVRIQNHIDPVDDERVVPPLREFYGKSKNTKHKKNNFELSNWKIISIIVFFIIIILIICCCMVNRFD